MKPFSILEAWNRCEIVPHFIACLLAAAMARNSEVRSNIPLDRLNVSQMVAISQRDIIDDDTERVMQAIDHAIREASGRDEATVAIVGAEGGPDGFVLCVYVCTLKE